LGIARRRTRGRRLVVSAAAGGVALTRDAVFRLRDVDKIFRAGGAEFRLHVTALDVERGAKIALIGESGSGKSTLLELLAMILEPSSTRAFSFAPSAGVAFDVRDLWRAGDANALGALRSRHVGYVLQHGGLLPYLTVRENIELPRRLLAFPSGRAATDLAVRLGIEAQLDKLPAELSVGQRQRVGIARALAHDPEIVLADEPTAALDPANAERIFALLVHLADALGVTLIVATHAQDLARRSGLALVEHRASAFGERATAVTVNGAS
jgi:putative ABC transport system ATP-binding protein